MHDEQQRESERELQEAELREPEQERREQDEWELREPEPKQAERAPREQ